MRRLVLNRPTFGFVLGTRVALGVGVGLLLGARLSHARRERAGRALLALGALTTIPAALLVLRGNRRGRLLDEPPSWKRQRILPPRRRRHLIAEMQ
jgi:hypothetical protein